MIKKIVLLFSLVYALNIQAQFKTPTNWDWQFPKVFDGAFNSICKVSDGMIAVGDKSSMMKSKDGGQTWKQITINTEFDIISVEFLKDEKTGYFFTKNGQVYKSTNSGDSWAVDASFPTVSDTILSANIFQDTIAVYYNHKSTQKGAYSLITSGSTWKEIKLKKKIGGGQYPFYWTSDIKFYNQNNGYLSDSVYFYGSYAFDYSGNYTVNSTQNERVLNVIWLPVSGKVITPGIYDQYIYSSGQFQKNSSLDNNAKNMIRNSSNVYAYNEVFWFATGTYFLLNATLLKTTDGGNTFSSLGNPPRVNDIYFIDEFEANAACNGSQIINTVNSGSLWTNTLITENSSFNIGTDKYQYVITNITRSAKGDIYGCGYCINMANYKVSSCIVKSNDWGKTWKSILVYENLDMPVGLFGTGSYVRRFYAFDDNHFILLKFSKNDMKKFLTKQNQSQFPFAVVEFHYWDSTNNQRGMTSLNEQNNIYDLHPFDAKSGKLLGLSGSNPFQQNAIFDYRFNLSNLSLEKSLIADKIASQALYVINFGDKNTGFVGGEGGKILRTTDGGKIWTDASVAGVRINNIQCINKDTAFVVSNSGGFFRTYNGSDVAVTWTAKALKTNDSIYNLNFFNGQSGFVVTNDQIMTTTDGGNNFTKIPIPFDYWGAYDTAYFEGAMSWDPKINVKLGLLTGNVLAGDISMGSLILTNNGYSKSIVLTLGNGPTSYPNGIESKNQLPVYLDIFPNPIRMGELLNIQVENNANISIYDINGKAITLNHIGKNVSTENLSPGIYMLKIVSEGKVYTRKVVVIE